MNRKRLLVSAAGVLVALAIAGGVAYATIPGPGNVYSACMLKSVGTIRLIDKSLPSTNLMSHCTDKEIEVSWNQAGQPGPAGPQGAKGDPGAPGTNGTNGTDGAAGKDGVSVTTASEPAGANCAVGGVQLTAVNGINYVCNGKAGTDGKDGTNGINGADGKDGQKGDPGDTGPTGPAGPQGPPGPPGSPGTGTSSLDDLNGAFCQGGRDTAFVQYLSDSSVKITCGDSFEPNNSAGQATHIEPCSTCGDQRDLVATIDPPNAVFSDDDWFVLPWRCVHPIGSSLFHCSIYVSLTGPGVVMNVNGGADTTQYLANAGFGWVSPPNEGVTIRVHSTSGAAYTLTVSNPAGY
jgi:hypothetical protein